MNWKKSIVFFVSFSAVFFAEIAINIACGPEQDPYDYYVSFFHNNVQAERYTPFAFNGLLYLNSEEDIWDEKDVNSAEWARYLTVQRSAVKQLMYGLDSLSEAKLKANAFKWSTNLPDSLKRNSFLIALNKNKTALKYYQLIKRYEPMISGMKDSWVRPEVDSVLLKKSATDVVKRIETTQDKFLKLRYAYQAQRMYRYAGDVQMSKSVYEKYIANNSSTSAVKGWALAHYAGLVRIEGDPDRAAYLFSKVFASNPEKRILAYRNYFWTDANLSDVLKLAKNDEEKANIYAINGFHQPDSDISNLKEVYECNPRSPLVAALLIREVNKLEQNLLKRSEMSYDYFSAVTDGGWLNYGKNLDSLEKANIKHLDAVRNFAIRLANEKRYTSPAFGNITAAYLSWIENNDTLALNYLNSVNPENLTAKLKDQYRITELLIKANRIKKGKSFNENELVPALKWLDEKRFAENKSQPTDMDGFGYAWTQENASLFTKTTRNFYQQILAPAYTAVGDTAKAALAMLKGDLRYRKLVKNSFANMMSYQTNIYWHQCLSEKTLAQLATYKANKETGTLLGLLASGLNQLKSDDFYELQGTAYLRVHQYAKALQCFNKLSKNFKFWTPENWEWLADGKHIVHPLFANSFAETLTDYPKTYLNKPNGLNKKTFAQKMLRLEKLVQSDKKNAASYYYQMANGLYQTGEFGNSWFFISYDWRVFINTKRAKYNYNADYKLALKAKEYYVKARALSTEPNFKAKCTFMLARCEQKAIRQKYEALTWNDNEDYEKQYQQQLQVFKEMNRNNPYFGVLKNQYAGTSFYQTAVNECSYLRDFLGNR